MLKDKWKVFVISTDDININLAIKFVFIKLYDLNISDHII